MNTVQLKCAIEVWRSGSINKAAERLYMNQASLSRTVKAIEEEYDVTLFIRTATGMEVTDEGLRFLEEALKVVEGADNFDRLFKTSSQGRFSFRIAVPRASYLSSAFSSVLASGFGRGAAPIHITWLETNNYDIIQSVCSLGYDLGVIRFPLDYETTYKKYLAEKQLKFQEIKTYPSVVIMHRSHPLAGRARLRLSDLTQYTILSHGDNHFIRFSDQETDQLYKTHLAENEITIFDRGAQFDFLCSIPGAFMLVSPMPRTILDKNRLVQIPLADNEMNLFEDLLITRRNRHYTEFERQFIQALYDQETDITKERYP